jgi:hypothetical protein
MYQFIRTVTPKHGAAVPAAVQFAAEVTGYLNKTYALNLRHGIQLFGNSQVYWEFEIDSLDKAAALNGKLLKDREYLGMLERVKDLWVDGSLEDSIVFIAG